MGIILCILFWLGKAAPKNGKTTPQKNPVNPTASNARSSRHWRGHLHCSFFGLVLIERSFPVSNDRSSQQTCPVFSTQAQASRLFRLTRATICKMQKGYCTFRLILVQVIINHGSIYWRRFNRYQMTFRQDFNQLEPMRHDSGFGEKQFFYDNKCIFESDTRHNECDQPRGI